MSEDELDAILNKAFALATRQGETPLFVDFIHQDVPRLFAEIKRLRGLSAGAEAPQPACGQRTAPGSHTEDSAMNKGCATSITFWLLVAALVLL